MTMIGVRDRKMSSKSCCRSIFRSCQLAAWQVVICDRVWDRADELLSSRLQGGNGKVTVMGHETAHDVVEGEVGLLADLTVQRCQDLHCQRGRRTV